MTFPFLLVFTPNSFSLFFGGRMLVPNDRAMMGPFNGAPSKRRGMVRVG